MEVYNKLASVIYAKSYSGQLDDIRWLFRNLDLSPKRGRASGLFVILAGAAAGAIATIGVAGAAWLIWG